MDTHALFRETFLTTAAELFPDDPEAREKLAARLDAFERQEMADALVASVVGFVTREGGLA